ncbi:MAG TPA: hypothetical protein VIH26_10330 [Anaerolineales bacterium]
MGSQTPGDDKHTVRLDMDELYRQAVELVGQQTADKLWKENRLDSEDNWPGKWAVAMEVIGRLREASADQ